MELKKFTVTVASNGWIVREGSILTIFEEWADFVEHIRIKHRPQFADVKIDNVAPSSVDDEWLEKVKKQVDDIGRDKRVRGVFGTGAPGAGKGGGL